MSKLHGDEGFTLVELLVSMALLSLMALFTLNGLSLINSMRDRALQQERRSEIKSVLRFLVQDIVGAVPHFQQQSDGQGRLLFAGKEASISLVVEADGTREYGGLYLAHYALNDKSQLTATRHLLRQTATGEPLVLLTDVAQFSLSYGDAPNWDQPNQLPHKVHITITDMTTGESFGETGLIRTAGH